MGKKGTSIKKKIWPLFQKIKGIDLNNDTGALEDFYSVLTLALEISKELQSPGIVIDPEFYNNYDMKEIKYVSKQTGLKPAAVQKELISIGRNVQKIIDDTYPDAIVWILYTKLRREEGRTEPFIVKGMLMQALENKSKSKIICGGERAIGYCQRSLQVLQEKITTRKNILEPYLKKYPNLKLGAPICPWNTLDTPRVKRMPRNCRRSEIRELKDFPPLVEMILDNYQFVWIYAAGFGGYRFYDETINPPFNQLFEKVKQRKILNIEKNLNSENKEILPFTDGPR